MRPKTVNKAVLRAFLQRRKINALGLTVLTMASASITLISALTHFTRTDVLVIVTLLMALLCLLQALKTRKGFRTVHTGGLLHKKRPAPQDDPSSACAGKAL